MSSGSIPNAILTLSCPKDMDADHKRFNWNQLDALLCSPYDDLDVDSQVRVGVKGWG